MAIGIVAGLSSFGDLGNSSDAFVVLLGVPTAGMALVVLARRRLMWFWAPLTLGTILQVTGLVLTAVSDLAPAQASLFQLVGYLLWILALGRVIRRAFHALGPMWLLNALIGSLAAAIVAWSLVLSDTLSQAGAKVSDLVRVGTPVMVALLLMSLIAAAAARRGGHLRLVLGALALSLMAEMLRLRLVESLPATATSEAMWILSAWWLAAASLDRTPSVAWSDRRRNKGSNSRRALLGASLMAVPLATVHLAQTGMPSDRYIVAGAGVVLGLLVTMRLTRSHDQHEAAIRDEREVREAVSSIVAAESVTEVVERSFAILERIVRTQRPVALGVIEFLDAAPRVVAEQLFDSPVQWEWSQLWPDLHPSLDAIEVVRDDVIGNSGWIMAAPMASGNEDPAWLVVVSQTRLDPSQRSTVMAVATAAALSVSTIERADLAARTLVTDRVASVVDHLPDVLVVVDHEGVIKMVNAAAEAMLGADRTVLEGVELADLVEPQDAAVFRAAVAEVAADLARVCTVNLHFGPPGRQRLLDAALGALPDSVDDHGIVCALRDVTERHQLEEKLRHQALHDGLTGLPNRVAFRERLEVAVAHARTRRSPLSVAFIDVDDFKVVNDTLGHAGGDQIIQGVADRLVQAAGSSGFVARLAGDEFAVLFADLNEERAVALVQRAIDSFSEPLIVEDTSLPVSVSVGLAGSDAASRLSAEVLLRNADAAMYQSKRRGKGVVSVFEPFMHTQAIELLQLRADLRSAVTRNEFVVYYQPIVDVSTSMPTLWGFEALLRWQHPERGLLLPEAFIDEAEASDAIVEIGRFVFDRVCQDLADWPCAPGEVCPKITVNLANRQFDSPGLLDDVMGAVRRVGVAPDRLVLEITERSVVGDVDLAISRIERLKAAGVSVALDDFGTGYSSLNYLAQLPIDMVKIDRSFVTALDDRTGRAASVSEAIVALAHSLGLLVVGEGVELLGQLEHLKRMDCPLVQGYIFGRAEPLAGARAFAISDEWQQMPHLSERLLPAGQGPRRSA